MSQYKTDFLVPHVRYIGNVPRECPAQNAKTTLYGQEPIMWLENKPFKAALVFDRLYSNTNSIGCQAVLKDAEKDYSYVMNEDDFYQLIKTLPAVAGVFVGEWISVKSGRYISIKQA